MPCKWGKAGADYQLEQLKFMDDALSRLSLKGILPGVPGYDAIAQYRTQLLSKVGFKIPKNVISIIQLVGLSPGTIHLWFDIECGWLVESREKPGAPPVYRYVKDEVAMAILRKEITPELEKELLTPDDYLGE